MVNGECAVYSVFLVADEVLGSDVDAFAKNLGMLAAN